MSSLLHRTCVQSYKNLEKEGARLDGGCMNVCPKDNGMVGKGHTTVHVWQMRIKRFVGSLQEGIPG